MTNNQEYQDYTGYQPAEFEVSSNKVNLSTGRPMGVIRKRLPNLTTLLQQQR